MTLLLTSFTTWLAHQKSNSSDDLLAIIASKNTSKDYFLRQLPVDVDLASNLAIAILKKIQPQGIICCGMAESRKQLTIESNATCNENCLLTSLDLQPLISKLSHSAISHDAGKFVCEGLYYQVLQYLEKSDLSIPCIFVHVPILNKDNESIIVQDFQTILEYLSY
ncbi:MAG: peptidase C15 [Xenococcaceae cyanobacterium MO_167.B27]|nr:peptidase C15 [Xenococcaceae cyanobacterium MO_167.B27]